MSTPDIQFFPVSGTWAKPPGAVRVDIVLRGGAAGVSDPDAGIIGECGGNSGAYLGRRVNPNGIRCSNGEPGDVRVSSWDAAELDDTVEIEVGKGGRPGGRDGYALIVTHLAEAAEGEISPMVARPRARAVESAVDAAIAIRSGDIAQARSLLAEASRELDTAERRAEATR